ncbi:MAG: peptidoglycan editing factor PgeF, partial [Limnohabitans sp.]
VHSACSLRAGGVSAPPYDSLNLGDHVGDDPARVAENRLRFAQALGAKPVYLQQVHAWDTALLTQQTRDGTPADACITAERGLACTIMVADCLPVLFYLPTAKVVAAAHAGWRGLAAGVLEATLDHLAQFADTKACQIWLGPCIGPRHFEVGEDVKNTFCCSDAVSANGFSKSFKHGKYLADLAWLARRRLGLRGVAHIEGNDSTISWCTFSQPELFYSFRRDGVSGRFAAAIALV